MKMALVSDSYLRATRTDMRTEADLLFLDLDWDGSCVSSEFLEANVGIAMQTGNEASD